MFKGKNSVVDKRLWFSHQWRGLVASSAHRPWVGCLRLSLGFYSTGTGSARERDGKYSKQNAVTRRWLSWHSSQLSCLLLEKIYGVIYLTGFKWHRFWLRKLHANSRIMWARENSPTYKSTREREKQRERWQNPALMAEFVVCPCAWYQYSLSKCWLQISN